MASTALFLDRRLWVLRNFDLFKGLSDAELAELAAESRLIEFGKNSHVCMSGVQHTHAYLIKEGNVRIVMTHPNGKRLTLGILKPGELIGDIELLSNSLATGESAETMGPVVLYAVPLDVLRRLITNKPEFTLTISKIVGDRRTDIINRMQDVLFMTVPQRLSRLLLKLADDFPGETKSGRRFLNLKITHAELSDLIGANREAVSATLVKWKSAGIAESVKGYLVLKDESLLRDQ
jgi:CRP/FNR family transcriptional regulator, cyclic AMP receptor protein